MVRGSGADGPHLVDRHVGRRVCEKRIALGYNQTDLGQALGVTFQQVQKYEAGVNRISCARLLKILSVLNISLVDFFAGICVDEKVLVSDAELCLVRGFRRKDENVRRAILTLLQ